jgi:hypothetical protein
MLQAYHNDPKIKAKYLRRVRAHQKADQIVQGYGYWKDGKGCAVGCTLHGDHHADYETELGIPAELAYLEDHFFECLPVEVARDWPARFLSAIKPGANLTRVYDLWSAWNLIDPVDGVITLVSDEFPDIQRIVRETGEACLAGNRVNAAWAARAAWVAARAARVARAALAADAADAGARAALAADAADAGARAADAAWAARAERAADAAWAAARVSSRAAYSAAMATEAAWTARAAGAAWTMESKAARAAFYKRASDKLIELLQAAE